MLQMFCCLEFVLLYIGLLNIVWNFRQGIWFSEFSLTGSEQVELPGSLVKDLWVRSGHCSRV